MECKFGGNKRKLCHQDCAICFNKSFSSFQDQKKLRCLLDENPRNITISSGKKCKFKCDTCFHLFESRIYSVTGNNSWCPYCSNSKLCDNDCDICFKKSFASYDIRKVNCLLEQEKNNPRMIFLGSSEKFNFRCDTCFHEFDIQINNICNGYWCPYCSDQKLCNPNNNCNYCFKKSFANFDDKEKIKCLLDADPKTIFKGSDQKCNFKCNICNHIFYSSIQKITNEKMRRWCPFCCVPSKKLCENDCDFCYKKSFASYDSRKVNCLVDKDKNNPRYIHFYSNKKFEFKCYDCNNIFFSVIGNIVTGSWCPVCKNKTEKKLYEFLIIHYPKINREVKFTWTLNQSTQKFKRFDFCIESIKVIIELDGKQHFKQVLNWDSPETQKKNDIDKMILANENGYRVIRILQEDVYYDLNDWKKNILDAISLFIENIYEISNIMICENNEYEHFYRCNDLKILF